MTLEVPRVSRRTWLACAVASIPCLAQDEATFSTDVKVVNVLATVRTKKGEFVNNLSKEDFTLLENGRPQKVQYFSRETALPLTIGLLIDTSMSQEKVLTSERTASYRFIDQVLRPKDQVFVMQFDMAVMLRQALTGDRRQLEETLPLVDTPSRQELSYQRGGGTLLYDAVLKSAREIMPGLRGRKALIILSDGVDTGSEASRAQAIEASVKSDTLIYSILFSDEGYYGGFGEGSRGQAALQQLARETGGSFYAVSKKHTIDQIYALIEQELRSQYSLGYVSDAPVRISEFRKIQLTTERKDLVIQARNRYWAAR